MSDEKPILTEISEQIMTITLDRPERMNAYTRKLALDFMAALDEADANDGVRAVIVTGAGKAFCAGADLGSGDKTFDTSAKEEIDEHRDGGGLVTLRLFECKKPIIGAINGAAVGVGITMCLPMDIRLASSNAKFGFVFAKRGIVPEACSSWFLPRLVGISQAMEWVSTGRVFGADEALKGKLISGVLAPEELIPAARKLGREIAENTSAVSVALSRHMMWKMLGADHPMEAHKIDSKAIYYMGQSSDAKEGVMSFLEKRPAKFPLKVSMDMPRFFPWWKERKFSE